MTRPSLHLLMSIGVGLTLAGCGDDNNVTNTDSQTGGATESTTSTTSPTTTVEPTTVDPTTGTDPSGMTEAMSSTDTPETTTEASASSTGDTSTGDIVDTTGPDSTTTTGDDTTTTGDTTGDTTTGDTTTGDTTTGDTTTGDPVEECILAENHKPCDAASNDAMHAIGLNCTSLGGDYVNFENATAIAKPVFQAPAEMLGKRSWQVAKSYGTYIDPMTNKPFWSAHEGEKLLLISSGLLPPPNAQGVVIVDDGDVYNDTAFGGQWDTNSMPPPMKPNEGSPDPMGFTNCDGVNDCSNTLNPQWTLGNGNAEDKMWFGFELTAPAVANGQAADAKGFNFDFAYFSAEFPEYVDSQFNDIFVVWQASEKYTGNVIFINKQPLTVTALWPIDYQEGDEHLQGTGHIDDGGATGWYQANGGVEPGETFTLTFAIFDMGDSTFDTTAIIDKWQWDCEGCIPNEVDDCEITPM